MMSNCDRFPILEKAELKIPMLVFDSDSQAEDVQSDSRCLVSVSGLLLILKRFS